MRFGSRRDDDSRASEVLPVSRSAVEVAPQPVIPSKRLQRVAEHFHTQAELLGTMRQEFETEMEPLHELLVHQASTMQRLLTNLEERLRPLNKYADGEEADLNALEHRVNESGSDHVARSFAEYLAEQRDTVEVALSRFDADMDALETNLAEQRKVMLRMLDSMRSETFAAVKNFLVSRQDALSALAGAGSTDPAEIGRSVQHLRRALEPMADTTQVRPVLERFDQADRRLVAAAPANQPPRVIAPDEPMLRDLSPDESTDEATA